ncbi:sensor histidine kinase [Asanoa iriomotensis]|uniref:Histidine kinase domain-containing protein n=1 Tax=Asanoa iriomotensis TaxID=234613 RepID=A0ABQ4C0T3_9ACTN|nr:ATP-binding protein [Asanoa iriomotensis]GIF56386.1 hypothetical protein Air01nite_24810 [Asanoa iriomotensis]
MRRVVARHLAAAAALGVVFSALVTLGVWRYAAADARHTAERVGRQVAAAVLAPMSAHDIADPGAMFGYLDPFLRSGTVQRAKLFTVRDGQATVVYSDEPRDERLVEGLSPALRPGDMRVQAVPVNAVHQRENSLRGTRMEVFFGFDDSLGRPAALELYVPVDVAGTTARGVAVLLPVAIGGFAVVALLMLPGSVFAARRSALRHGHAAAELTRRDLARRLHDQVIPDLAAAGLLLERADGSTLVRRAHRLVTTDVARLRGLLTDLLPETAVRDPAVALRQAVERADTGSAPPVEVRVDPGLSVAPPTVLALQQIATELLRNAFRHAAASQIVVALAPAGRGAVALSVTDDGTGFDPGAAVPAGHVGLRLVGRLVADLHGRLDIATRPGGGTMVGVVIPSRPRR